MTSGVPQNFNAAFIAGIDKLIKEAKVILVGTNPHQSFNHGHEYNILNEYRDWNRKVGKLFNTDDLTQLLPGDFNFAEEVNLPKGHVLGVDSVRDESYSRDLMKFRVELRKEISSQIVTLREIKNKSQKQDALMFIYIRKDGLIWRDDQDKNFHKSRDFKVKRVQLLVVLSKNSAYTTTKSLLKKPGYKDLQTLSKEKNKINELLKGKLHISHDIIIGGLNNRSRGYRINPAFRIIIVPK